MDFIFTRLKAFIEIERKDISGRRQWTTVDLVADGMDRVTRELADLVADLERETERLTPSQYAQLHKKTEQTIRNWIRRGELAADGDARMGYSIARGARRVRRLKVG